MSIIVSPRMNSYKPFYTYVCLISMISFVYGKRFHKDIFEKEFKQDEFDHARPLVYNRYKLDNNVLLEDIYQNDIDFGSLFAKVSLCLCYSTRVILADVCCVHSMHGKVINTVILQIKYHYF